MPSTFLCLRRRWGNLVNSKEGAISYLYRPCVDTKYSVTAYGEFPYICVRATNVINNTSKYQAPTFYTGRGCPGPFSLTASSSPFAVESKDMPFKCARINLRYPSTEDKLYIKPRKNQIMSSVRHRRRNTSSRWAQLFGYKYLRRPRRSRKTKTRIKTAVPAGANTAHKKIRQKPASKIVPF